MKSLSQFLSSFGLDLPIAAILLAVVGGWILASWGVERAYKGKLGKQLVRQVIQLFLLALALLLILILLPLPQGVRPELINLIGIVLSATIALSSTTFLSNAMAGVMLRAVHNFRTGDMIECGDNRGRVTERGLFHIEIQNERSDLVTLPNLFLVTHPVRVTKEAGTIVSAEVSLGYDVSRARIEELLLKAAHEIGLEKPFVWILELGDFSVRYQAAGMLRPATDLLSAHSRLKAAMLDSLHRGSVEIVSPTFMNQRSFPLQQSVIPPDQDDATIEAASSRSVEPPEELVFRKAKDAASLEKQQAELEALDAEIRELDTRLGKLAEGPERNGTAARLERRRREHKRRAAVLDRQSADAAPKED